MDKVLLVGNLIRDPEINYSKDKNLPYSRCILAVDDRIGKTTHFIPFIIFDKNAKILCEYGKKGSKIGITGYIKKSYFNINKSNTIYNTNMIAESFEFIGFNTKKNSNKEDLKLVSNSYIPFKNKGDD